MIQPGDIVRLATADTPLGTVLGVHANQVWVLTDMNRALTYDLEQVVLHEPASNVQRFAVTITTPGHHRLSGAWFPWTEDHIELALFESRFFDEGTRVEALVL